MMYQGMDLSRFKKVASDGKVSTLRHSRGHEVKIAHSGLSPKMREHIDSMPVHLAEGGDPAAIDPESPAEVTEDDQPAPTEGAPTEGAPTEAPRTLPPKPAVMPVAGTVDIVAPSRPARPKRPPPPTAEELDNEAATFADDMTRGYIKPETMADLFATKDTLGKLGTIFGLMIGGAGAGLTHQPNALLEIMQKELDRDLEAQKVSNTNSQNWLKLSHEYQLQKAQKAQMQAETAYREGQTGMIPQQKALLEAQTNESNAGTQLKAYNTAEIATKLAALQHFTGIVAKMPPGAARDNAQNVLTNVIQPAVTASIKQGNAKTAAKIQLHDAMSSQTHKEEPQEDGSGSGVDLDKLTALERQGAAAGTFGMPGVAGMTPAQGATARQEAGIVAENRAIAKMFVDAFNRLDTAFAGGVLNQNQRDAEIASLGQQMAQRIGNSTSQKEYERVLQSMFPSATDWGGAREAKFQHGIAALKSLEAGTPTLDQFKLKTPFPAYARLKKQKKGEKGGGAAMAAPSAKEGDTSTSRSGKPIIFRNGKWVYK